MESVGVDGRTRRTSIDLSVNATAPSDRRHRNNTARVDGDSGVLVTVLAVAVAVPIFLSFGSGRLALGESPRNFEREVGIDAVDLPLSFFLAIPMVLALLGATGGVVAALRAAPTRFRVLTTLFTAFAVMAYIYGFSYPDRGNELVRLGFLAQTVQPILFGYVGVRLIRTGRDLAFLDAWSKTITAFCALHLLLTLVNGGDDLMGYAYSLGPWNNSRALRFFPFMAALSATYLLVRALRESTTVTRRFALFNAATCIALVGISHSRTALLCVIGGAILTVLSPTWSASGSRLTRKSLSDKTLVLLAILIIGLSLPALGLRPVTRLIDSARNLNRADARRIEAFLTSLADGMSSAFGNAFRATVEVSTAGQSVDMSRIGISENQFGEYALRGGPLLLVAFAGLLWAAGRGSRRVIVSPQVSTGARFAAIAVPPFVVFASFTQLSFSEAYSAPLLWLLLGILAEAARMSRRRSLTGGVERENGVPR